MIPEISIIVPAWNEGNRIEETLGAIRRGCARLPKAELIVVDDGSRDATFELAIPWADLVVQHPQCYGKGTALNTGRKMAKGQILVFLDADLGSTAEAFTDLVEPLVRGDCDMVIAVLPEAKTKGGIGLVKQLAKRGVYRLCGFETTAPLSGQRAVQSEMLDRIGRLAEGFGVEVGLTIDAIKLGYRVQEKTIAFSHRESGRDLLGWYHRGKQFCAVGGTLWNRWRQPIC
ncbi:glycosyltransferase family 2 protein [Paenibacillus rigui]|uniref:Glucosyl-3-phosphoglycerate synthase n=1 Tax=Paenibacillus rigui TaxID=554312 RepID=A0A229UXS0_9BACL|nr:glycosyltransferase family 2 protein [Paenibacillus rigui]OXM88153.1 hypothetical protein CF651_03430 [Paenibacillus rigui]